MDYCLPIGFILLAWFIPFVILMLTLFNECVKMAPNANPPVSTIIHARQPSLSDHPPDQEVTHCDLLLKTDPGQKLS